jgi:hypothetical protein
MMSCGLTRLFSQIRTKSAENCAIQIAVMMMMMVMVKMQTNHTTNLLIVHEVIQMSAAQRFQKNLLTF